MQESNMVTVNFIICPSKANSWRLNSILCNKSEPKKCIVTWQMTEVSNSTKRHADNSENHADLALKNLPRPNLTAQLFLKFLLITQHEVPFMNMSDWSNKKGWVTEQRMANVQISQMVFNWPQFYTFFSAQWQKWPFKWHFSPTEAKFIPHTKSADAVFF